MENTTPAPPAPQGRKRAVLQAIPILGAIVTGLVTIFPEQAIHIERITLAFAILAGYVVKLMVHEDTYQAEVRAALRELELSAQNTQFQIAADSAQPTYVVKDLPKGALAQ